MKFNLLFLLFLSKNVFSNNCSSDPNFPYKNCFPLVNYRDLEDRMDEYVYKDPRTNPKFTPSQIRQYRSPVRFIDLNLMDPEMTVATNFKFKDFLQKKVGRYGVFSSFVISTLQDMRDALGQALKVNSGYRSPAYNSKIDGAASWSRHMYGDALDLSTPTSDFQKAVKRECENKKAGMVILYKTHIHCDWRTTNLDLNFYDPAFDLTPTSQLVTEFIPETIEVDFQIENEDYKVGDLVRATATGALAHDDEGDLLVEWKVTNPLGKVTQKESSFIKFRPLQKGWYKIQVTVGGSVTQEKQILIE